MTITSIRTRSIVSMLPGHILRCLDIENDKGHLTCIIPFGYKELPGAFS